MTQPSLSLERGTTGATRPSPRLGREAGRESEPVLNDQWLSPFLQVLVSVGRGNMVRISNLACPNCLPPLGQNSIQVKQHLEGQAFRKYIWGRPQDGGNKCRGEARLAEQTMA